MTAASNKASNQNCESEIDPAILDKCRVGDRTAQERLYEICHNQTYRLIVRMVGLQDAVDVTQQVFLQVFRKIDQFEGKSKFQTWLYRISMNEALQHLRKRKRWDTEPLVADPLDEGRAEAKNVEQKELLDLALERIDPDLRMIFVLREVEGLSYRDIADVVAVAEGTVGSRLNRARRELHQLLTDLGWEP